MKVDASLQCDDLNCRLHIAAIHTPINFFFFFLFFFLRIAFGVNEDFPFLAFCIFDLELDFHITHSRL